MKDVEIIFIPALWSHEDAGDGIKFDSMAEVYAVNGLTVARAFENQCHVAFVNGAGNFKINESSCRLIGRTQAASPFKGSIGRLNHNREGVLWVDFDMSIGGVAEKAYRIKEDFKKKRYCSAYRPL